MAFIPIAMMALDKVEVDGIYYNINTTDNTASVTHDGNKYTGEVVIPATIVYDGVTYDVTEIGNSAFYKCTDMTSITIPISVTSIGYDAFAGCKNLTSVNIPNRVTTIGSAAFAGCTGLTSINIPNSVTTFGAKAFQACENLTSVNIPNSVTTLSGDLFFECYNLTSVNIPNSVTSIGGATFYSCGLTSINIPNSVTSIGDQAFACCPFLTSINIPNSVTSIGAQAFECSGLTSINIPNSVTSIGNGAFGFCSGLKSVNISNNVTSIGEFTFRECSALESIIIPDAVTSIGPYAFANCSSLKNVDIGSGITRFIIGRYDSRTFYKCPLRVVTCHATSVPGFYDTAGQRYGSMTEEMSIFYESSYKYATLIVPDEAYEAYSTTTPWKDFGNIAKMSEATVVTAHNYTREYGEPNPTFEYTSTAPLNGEPAFFCPVGVNSAPGTYVIGISQGTATNTGLIFVNGTLTITKAPLTAKVNSYTINTSDAMPTFDATYTGLKNGEAETVLNPVFTCTATDSNTPGIYDITLTTTTNNYDVTIEPGTLTIKPASSDISITAAGMGTYCSPYDLDFSGVTDLRAYIITGYDWQSKRVYATRVYDVPAGTGIYLVGNAGDYNIPSSNSTSYYINMLVGTLSETWIDPTDGDYTNLRLTGSDPSNASFKTFSKGRAFSANRAYLQIPTDVLSNSANAVGIIFDDEVDGIEQFNMNADDSNADWYTLDGRKLSGKPTQKGVYVVKGRKIVVK